MKLHFTFPRLSSHSLLALCTLILVSFSFRAACAQEAEIRKNLPAHLPDLPKITKVTATPMNGWYELVLVNNEVVYSDARGKYLLLGEILDTVSKTNLTQNRISSLTAVAFKDLPLKDAFTVVRGNGQRKLAVFTDPNCGYCKRLEGELQKVDNVTIYQFLFPILGSDSLQKAKTAWCTPKRSEAWLDWMLRGVALPPEPEKCDTSAIDRNLAFGHSKAIRGTPAVFFPSGKRISGALPAADIEKQLAVK